HYLDIIRRRKWIIIQGVVVVGVLAFVLSNLRTSIYEGRARVLLRPNDPAKQIDPETNTNRVDADRNVAAQIDIIEGDAVSQAAAQALGLTDGTKAADLCHAHQVGQTDLVDITVRSADAQFAADAANACSSA